jgi:hypothetical protein
VELRGAHDAPRHAAVAHDPLLGDLGLVVGVRDALDAGDRDGHVVADAGAPLGDQQALRAGDEHGGRLPAHAVGGVDHRVGARRRGVEPGARREVDLAVLAVAQLVGRRAPAQRPHVVARARDSSTTFLPSVPVPPTTATTIVITSSSLPSSSVEVTGRAADV